LRDIGDVRPIGNPPPDGIIWRCLSVSGGKELHVQDELDPSRGLTFRRLDGALSFSRMPRQMSLDICRQITIACNQRAIETSREISCYEEELTLINLQFIAIRIQVVIMPSFEVQISKEDEDPISPTVVDPSLPPPLNLAKLPPSNTDVLLPSDRS
jgi:hypothetical protein